MEVEADTPFLMPGFEASRSSSGRFVLVSEHPRVGIDTAMGDRAFMAGQAPGVAC